MNASSAPVRVVQWDSASLPWLIRASVTQTTLPAAVWPPVYSQTIAPEIAPPRA